jgi:glycosyltransferase involved in cell wall biosynthesis
MTLPNLSTISVVMATYNRAAYIPAALDSLVSQTRPPLEVLIIDDNSSDDTDVRVRDHPLRDRIRYERLGANRGAAEARNLAASRARGEILVFLDSDDVLEPSHHEVVRELFESASRPALFCCDCVVIDEDGRLLHEGRTWTAVQCSIKREVIASGPRSLADIFRFSTPFPGLSIRRDLYLRLGGLDQSLFPLDDYDLQLRVAGAGEVVHYEHRSLARYRVHGTNESGASKAVRVGQQKLRCLKLTVERFGEAAGTLGVARRRRGEVRLELAVAQAKEGSPFIAAFSLLGALSESPIAGVRELKRLLGRRLQRDLVSVQ